MGMIDLFIDIVNVILYQKVEGATKPFFYQDHLKSMNEMKSNRVGLAGGIFLCNK